VKIETKWSHSCHVPGNRVRKIKKHGPEKRMGQEKKGKELTEICSRDNFTEPLQQNSLSCL
jgi:hypothetical protein